MSERFYVAIHRRLAETARRRPEARALGLKDRDVSKMVGEDVPTFVLARRHHEDRLVRELALRPVRRTQRFVLLANPAAGGVGLPIARER